jgi:hypothetical protein
MQDDNKAVTTRWYSIDEMEQAHKHKGAFLIELWCGRLVLAVRDLDMAGFGQRWGSGQVERDPAFCAGPFRSPAPTCCL